MTQAEPKFDAQAYVMRIGEGARAAARAMARAPTVDKNNALAAVADAIQDNAPQLTRANHRDAITDFERVLRERQ